MINAEYGKPALVRFENHLDENPLGLDRQDFGSPDLSFLTHLHNGHTAPESDGNPHYSMRFGPKHEGYRPGMSVDNLYLNWPAGGDDREKQSFFWFHDHRMDHTGSNVYKGMVGLYPIYDPKNGLDMGDERRGLRLPGRRTDHADGSFDVDYDIPLAFFDCRLDDGVTEHKDVHDSDFPEAGNPRTHPEWWGKSFFRHMPHKGFVGDIFTVNGTAYPTLEVKRRKYRFRFLDASIARIYDFKLMSSTQGPKAAKDLGYQADDLDGQWRIEDGQQCMKFTQVASDGGLLPFAVTRDNFELWPAKRREVIIDFTRYQDGTPTTKGDVVYLTNVMKMDDGLMWTNSARQGSSDPNYKVPVLKFVIGDTAPDDSLIPETLQQLRPLPPLPNNWQSMMDNRLIFRVERAPAHNPIDEVEWQINGHDFDTSDRGEQPEEPGRQDPARHAEEGQLQPLGDPERRRRLGAPVPPAHGGAPDRDARRQGRLARQPGASRRPRAGGRLGARPGGVRDPVSRFPGLQRPVRRALPQPGARGPRDDVRLGDHPLAEASSWPSATVSRTTQHPLAVS